MFPRAKNTLRIALLGWCYTLQDVLEQTWVDHRSTTSQLNTKLRNPPRQVLFLFSIGATRRPSELASDTIPLGSGPDSAVPLVHTELEDLAASPGHQCHLTRSSYLDCHRRPCPRHVNWRTPSSFETALLQMLCRTFS